MTQRRQFRVVVGTVFLILVCLAALEAAFRNRAPRDDDQLYDAEYISYLIDAAGPIFIKRRIDGTDFLVPKASKSSYVQTDQRVRLSKKLGTRRIAVVGESSALGLGIALGNYIHQVASKSGIEVLNMGFGGASLEQVENNSLEALRYEPDIIILCFGHNLMMRHPALSPFRLKLNSAVRKSHFLSFIIDRRDRPKYVQPALDARLDALNAFIRNMARLTRERNIKFMICTMPSNLNFPPLSDEAERAAGPYLESIYEAAASHGERALRILQAAADANPVPLWNFQAAQWLLRKGEYFAANKRFLAARDLDPQHDRAATSVNALIRSVGNAEKLVVLDFARMVTARAPHGISGWESFIDHVHVSRSILLLEASASWRECRGLFEGGPVAEPAPSSRWEEAGWQEFVLDAARKGTPYQKQRSAAVRSIFSEELRLNEREFVPLLRKTLADEANFKASSDPAFARAQLALNAADAFFWAGRSLDAARLSGAAHQWSPRWVEPYVESGLYAVRARDNVKARDFFEKALALEPGRRDAEFFLEKLRETPNYR